MYKTGQKHVINSNRLRQIILYMLPAAPLLYTAHHNHIPVTNLYQLVMVSYISKGMKQCMNEVCMKAKQDSMLFFFLPPLLLAYIELHSQFSFFFIIIHSKLWTILPCVQTIADPTWDQCLDCALLEFEDKRLIFMVDGKMKEEAMEILRALWTINHAKSMKNWKL